MWKPWVSELDTPWASVDHCAQTQKTYGSDRAQMAETAGQ